MPPINVYSGAAPVPKKAPTFSKVFRWEPPNPQTPPPQSVAVTGTFSDWQAIPLELDQSGKVWQLTLTNLPGNCTHRYMLLVDGQPVKDANADGLAIPATAQEKAWALATPRGPRVFMLFSQTK